MNFYLALLVARFLATFIAKLHLGAGSTWPGEVVLLLCPSFLEKVKERFSLTTIIVAGTNGKTTTTQLIREGLLVLPEAVISNLAGANILNGLASALVINYAQLRRGPVTAVFEVDEAVFPTACQKLVPRLVCLLNLFRDQLDRYAELEITANKWRQALSGLPSSTKVILNADDPLVANLGLTAQGPVIFFGLGGGLVSSGKEQIDSGDSRWCLECGSELTYKGCFYAHLGFWSCPHEHITRPHPNYLCSGQRELAKGGVAYRLSTGDREVEVILPLRGIYSASNVAAASAVLGEWGLALADLASSWADFQPAFGRQEEIGPVLLLLAKNPTGLNENLKLVTQAGPGPLMLMLNDGVADGRDVSWIYDVDPSLLAEAVENRSVWVAGSRAEEMALRLQYALGNLSWPLEVNSSIEESLTKGQASLKPGEKLYLLPTYTAMLESRRVLQGRKIL